MSIFGKEFEEIWPIPKESEMPITKFGRSLLDKCRTIPKPDKTKVNIEDFINKSANFALKFGTETCRVASQPESRRPIIEQQIASAYPVIHERVLHLYLNFLEHKQRHGTHIEREVFSNQTPVDFINRLLRKRCASFFGEDDTFLLLNGMQSCGGFMEIGTVAERPPLILKDVLSYDEIKLSALLSVSSHSEFLNDGNRFNEGKIEEDKSKIETEGVVIGIIGARFECPEVMEYQDILITKNQNTKVRGYGLNDNDGLNNSLADYRRLWKTFYNERDFTYEEVEKDGIRFGDCYNPDDIFDNLIMKKRYTISFDTLLLDSEARAAAAGKQAYIHVVGIGLGVWKIAEHQVQIFLETFTQRLKNLLPKLQHISVVNFSHFRLNECGDLKNGAIFKDEKHPEGGITTFFSKRNPADKLEPEQADKLVIVSYAWDGNALPGNEFWMGMLSSTGDSSTACSTIIAEIQNPHINEDFVNGNNLHIVSERYGLLHITEFANLSLGNECSE